ncbi:hypothetical protein [Kitasatospora purpeofusca]|uniref:Secreted protein n=1 Tax=Kitasatospora purpeofusca TaxID=67352 RepID=A0ABZ1UAZ1_9ACTN|nr:hypothetical protein [Kitasatospora purpeofusca]
MTRKMLTTAAATGALALALAGATPAVAAGTAATTATTGTATEVCDASGLQSGLWTKLCYTVTEDGVQFTGRIGLAGPPSPGSPPLRTKLVDAALTTDIEGGESLGTVQQSLLFRATTLEIAGYGGTVPCGSTVTATFSVSADGWYTAPISTSVVVPC